MASVPLKCSICPKQPTFSDISHLLTHVSSKGHLAHLHKLQVRSHQEIGAGQALASYDLWYQQNGLGQLLSERLQQKDTKRAASRNKRAKVAPKRTLRSVLASSQPPFQGYQSSIPSRPSLRSITSATGNFGSHRSFGGSVWDDNGLQETRKSDDGSVLDSSPTQRLRGSRSDRIVSTPMIKRSSSDTSGLRELVEDEDDEEDDDTEASKLKGLVWPGMNLFDAATEEMRRKRNQKKDGSLLKQMEKSSKRIEATETIYSPSGILRKRRPITGNVEDTSPLKGESPIPKKRVPRPKRPALSEISANLPPTRRRSARSTNAQATSLDRPQSAFPYLPISSVVNPYDIGPRYSPTEDEKAEFNLTFRYLSTDRRKGGLKVFRDENLDGQTFNSSSRQSIASAPTYDHHGYDRAENYPASNDWHGPRHVPSQPAQNPWRAPRSGQCQPWLGVGKENIDPALASHRNTPHENPLGWAGMGGAQQDQRQYLGGLHQVHSNTLAVEPLGYSTNPLSLAFQQLGQQQQNPLDARLQTLDGIIEDRADFMASTEAFSDHEGAELPDGFFGDERH